MQAPAPGPAFGEVPSPAPLEAVSKTSSTAGSKRGRADDDEPTRPGPTPLPHHRGSSNSRQYRVVPRAPAWDPNLPPRVITNAEIEAAKSALQFIDAQAVAEEGQDKEMSAFQDMLNEYLKLEGSSGIKNVNDDDDEYVYDLYYRDISGATAEGANIGALLGYEDLSPPSTPPDSEPEDEADEDSNDEDFYRNDYPEDEDADEDMVGFDDAYSDGEWSKEDSEEERDVWDYR
ncbi:hypothetical protein A1Q2_02787 [Trichosporon asahii var. asahii CBS 8904]|uniref:Probable RNA polymerase II nuclear localization protein SLC7A6OS n=1 Tax=Trichosporon asahii var. asahii (strain CBS 8904) TaxID=1220162 RepID=K1W1G9_TRIAC|nr:hypothetical protein A1Q2_02787 [Trichosporon asahii var. asahii CBS 8904]